MTLERYIRLIAGTFVLVSLALGYWVSPYWWLFTAFVGVNLFRVCPDRLVPDGRHSQENGGQVNTGCRLRDGVSFTRTGLQRFQVRRDLGQGQGSSLAPLQRTNRATMLRTVSTGRLVSRNTRSVTEPSITG